MQRFLRRDARFSMPGRGWAAAAAAAAAFVGWEIVTPRAAVRFEIASGSPFALRAATAGVALAGLAATVAFVARAEGRRAAAYAAVVLSTTPAWFVHGRTATTQILPLAGAAFVLAGLGVALFDVGAPRWARAIAIAVAVAGAAIGAETRGLAAVAAPAAIAFGAARWRSRGGAAALAIGAAIAAGAIAIVATDARGAIADAIAGPRLATARAAFDAPVPSLAYGLLPWSPLAALAIGRRPTSPAHLAVMLAAGLSIAAQALLAARGGTAVVVGVASIAIAVALALADEDAARAEPSVTIALVVVAVGALVARDVDLAPERVMVAFGADGADVPAVYVAAAAKAARGAIGLATALAALALVVPRAWLPTRRGLAVLGAGALAGLVLRTYAYPTLLARLSPGAALEAFARARRDGDELGLLGVDRRVSPAARTSRVLASPREAAAWLAGAAPTAERRFVALAAPELPRLNAEFRAARAANVPVLAGGDGAILLAASSLARGEKSESALDAVVVPAPPDGLTPLGAVLGDRLEAIGWELRDERGARASAVPRGRHAHVRVFVRVLAADAAAVPLNAYCTFLHVDHTPTRFSVEHRAHPYPLALWRAGDVVVDDFDVDLPPAFRSGRYALSWGVGVLPCEDDRRMPITSGPNDGRGRVPAGALEVR